MATCVQPQPSSQAASINSSTVIVPKVRVSWPSEVRTQATTVFLCTSKPAHRSYMTCIATSAFRNNGWQGYLKRQMLTCVLEGDRWRCLQGLRVRLLDRLVAPVSQTTSGPAAQLELYHMFMGGGDHRSWRLLANSRNLPSYVRASMTNQRFLAALDSSPTVSLHFWDSLPVGAREHPGRY